LFDLPKRTEIGVQRAEIVWWRSALPDGRGDLAGLSVAGPAIRGIDEPPLRRAGWIMPRIVRIGGFPAAGYGRDGSRAWALLPEHATEGDERIPLNPVADFAPVITREYNGAGVIDEKAGEILGIALTAARSGEKDVARMAAIGEIADQWPLLRRIIEARGGKASGVVGTTGPQPFPARPLLRSGNDPRPRLLSRVEFLQLIERCLQVPELADAQSRHTIVSELPLEVALGAPRSSVDRADLAALLWTCVQVPAAVAELQDEVRRKTRDGNDSRELLEDLGKLRERLLQQFSC
jgi:hypothetical protein